jgi:hypothetical protein
MMENMPPEAREKMKKAMENQPGEPKEKARKKGEKPEGEKAPQDAVAPQVF